MCIDSYQLLTKFNKNLSNHPQLSCLLPVGINLIYTILSSYYTSYASINYKINILNIRSKNNVGYIVPIA